MVVRICQECGCEQEDGVKYCNKCKVIVQRRQAKEWRERNKDKVKAYNDNRVYMNEKWKEYYQKNKDKVLKRNQRWKDANPEKAMQHQKDAIKRRYERDPSYKEFQIARGNYCQALRIQQGWQDYEMHHMIPVSLVPEFAFEDWNIIPLSPELHTKFHSSTGGTRKAKYPRYWTNDLVNFIHDEI